MTEDLLSKNWDHIDWSLTTWEGSRRAQLRRARTLTLRERMEAVEGMAEVARRFEEIRRAGSFRKAAGEVQGAGLRQPASGEPRE